MFYLIYKITNLVNGKIYIGKHKTNNIDDGYMGSGIAITNAIRKYGIHNFKKQILFQFNTEEEMANKEAEIVDEDFIKDKNTYNIALGGSGGDCKAACEKYKQLMKDPEFYSQWKEKQLQSIQNSATRQKISNALKSYYKTNEPAFKGRKHTKETKQLMRQKKIEQVSKKDYKNGMKGMRWITNNDTREIIKVPQQELQTYLNNGWIKGKKTQQQIKEKRRQVCNKNNKQKRITQVARNNTSGQKTDMRLVEKELEQVFGKKHCYKNKQTGRKKFFRDIELDNIDLTIWEETWTSFNVEEIKEMIAQKKSWTEIAEYYNTTYWSIYSWYRDNKHLFKN